MPNYLNGTNTLQPALDHPVKPLKRLNQRTKSAIRLEHRQTILQLGGILHELYSKPAKRLNQRTISAILQQHQQKISQPGGILHGLENTSTPQPTASLKNERAADQEPVTANDSLVENAPPVVNTGCLPFCCLFRRKNQQDIPAAFPAEKTIKSPGS